MGAGSGFILDASVASRYTLTAYDAFYLALALELKLPVAWSDGPLQAALKTVDMRLG